MASEVITRIFCMTVTWPRDFEMTFGV